MEAELPVAGKEDIVVDLTGNTLKISAEKKQEFNERRKTTCAGKENTVSQPQFYVDNIDGAAVTVNTEYKDGVLIATLPKKENGTSGQRIEIK